MEEKIHPLLKSENELDLLIEQCLSEAERLALLKKEMDTYRTILVKETNSTDTLNEKLRIKERELVVQYEENDRLKHNYERLKRRMQSLQSKIKEKVKNGN